MFWSTPQVSWLQGASLALFEILAPALGPLVAGQTGPHGGLRGKGEEVAAATVCLVRASSHE